MTLFPRTGSPLKMAGEERRILVIDDDPDTCVLLSHMLRKEGFAPETAGNSSAALQLLHNGPFDAILLDFLMPGMNGIQFCSTLQADPVLSRIPVIMVTSRTDEDTRSEALAAGVADFVTKMKLNSRTLSNTVNRVLEMAGQWNKLDRPVSSARLHDFQGFLIHLVERGGASPEAAAAISTASPRELYEKAASVGIDGVSIARAFASFFGVPVLPCIDPETVETGMLPAAFSRAHRVLAVRDGAMVRFVVTNPFDSNLLDGLESLTGKPLLLSISCPDCIDALLHREDTPDHQPLVENVESDQTEEELVAEVAEFNGSIEIDEKPSDDDVKKFPIRYIADSILYTAATEGASDIHIEPKPDHVLVRFRVDGDMKDVFTLKRKTGSILISRFKVLGGMDIAERRKPQDGTSEARIARKPYKMRFATTSTPQGESLIVRILDMYAKPRKLTELGMTEEQSKVLYEIAGQNSGAIIVCGPTGSGKTTTLYSLISHIDIRNRSLMTIEDPVEYRIPYANQQQVNEKAGVTFEALLRSAVRQDPDIVYLGEVRDAFSARTCLDLASTGHMTLTTLHSSNTTTALFRLERLGITRDDAADNLLGLLAQRLLKGLCQNCRKMRPITAEERDKLLPFTSDIPSEVPHPEGCPRCGFTGYSGRMGVYELMRFSPEVTRIIKESPSIPAMRIALKNAGLFLLSDHAILKMRLGLLSFEDVYRVILLEELRLTGRTGAPAPSAEAVLPERNRILLVDDDSDFRNLATLMLEAEGYVVEQASDGVEAIVILNTKSFDLVMSDIEMPGLDGFTMLQALQSKNLVTPLVFLTANDSMEKEEKGYELGAVDYIRKPIHKKTFLARVDRVIRSGGK